MTLLHSLVESNLASVSTEAAITALGQHDQLFHRQVLPLPLVDAVALENVQMIQDLLDQDFNLRSQPAGSPAAPPASSPAATSPAAVPDAEAAAA